MLGVELAPCQRAVQKGADLRQFGTAVTEPANAKALMAPSPFISTLGPIVCQTAGLGETIPGR